MLSFFLNRSYFYYWYYWYYLLFLYLQWRSCIDKNGKNYFYNINGQESAWSLPVVQTNDTPKALRRKSFDETLDGLIRRRTINSRPTDRNSKTQSVYIRPSSISSDENGSNTRAKSPTPSPRPSPRPRPIPVSFPKLILINLFQNIRRG